MSDIDYAKAMNEGEKSLGPAYARHLEELTQRHRAKAANAPKTATEMFRRQLEEERQRRKELLEQGDHLKHLDVVWLTDAQRAIHGLPPLLEPPKPAEQPKPPKELFEELHVRAVAFADKLAKVYAALNWKWGFDLVLAVPTRDHLLAKLDEYIELCYAAWQRPGPTYRTSTCHGMNVWVGECGSCFQGRLSFTYEESVDECELPEPPC